VIPALHSALYAGELTHARPGGPTHSFRYPIYMHLLDLDELPELNRRLRLFGVERPRPVSFRAKDHLGDPSRPLRDNLRRLFDDAGADFPEGRILLLTHCRVGGYVFNPVNLFWCLDREDRVAAVVADVRNTFGEGYPYVLPVVDGRTTWRAKKRMHVSPFFSLAGTYRFDLPAPTETAHLGIDLYHDERAVLVARLKLDRVPLTDASLLRMLASYPLMPLRVIWRIHWQALRLWAKGARVYSKPPYDPAAAAGEPA